jgi:hypothetical protein
MKELYDQIAFFTHVILLDQAFAHCPRFPTAASQGSLGRVSVPVWLIILSDQLKIVGLVSSYPTNYLFLPRLILERSLSLIIRYSYCPSEEHSPHRNEDILIPDSRVNSQVLYTRPPLPHILLIEVVRLACVKHITSLHSEPGSNSKLLNTDGYLHPKEKILRSFSPSKKNKVSSLAPCT